MSTNQSQFPSGLLAGGMMDGVINVWDPSKFTSSINGNGSDVSQQAIIASVEQHQGAIGGTHRYTLYISYTSTHYYIYYNLTSIFPYLSYYYRSPVQSPQGVIPPPCLRGQ